MNPDTSAERCGGLASRHRAPDARPETPSKGTRRLPAPRGLSAGAATILLSLLFVANLVAQPQITRQPTNLVVAIGGEARFIVAATGTQPLRYQWRFDDCDLEGATLSLLRITNAQPDHSGSYAVVVTDTIGSTTSQSATLTVDLEWVTYKWANSGLPYNGVVDFEMDRDGAMWMATVETALTTCRGSGQTPRGPGPVGFVDSL